MKLESEPIINRACCIGVEFRYFLVSAIAGVGTAIIGSLIYLLSWSSVYLDGTLLAAWAYVSMISGIFVMPIAVCLGYPLSKLFARKSNIFWLSVSLGLGVGFGLILKLLFSGKLEVLALGAVYGGIFGVIMILLRRIPQRNLGSECLPTISPTPESAENNRPDQVSSQL